MAAPSKQVTHTQEPETEEQRLRQKCKDLKKRIAEVEENNEVAALAVSRSRAAIKRMRLEFAVLLEVLEEKSGRLENDDLNQLMAIAKERSLSVEASNEQKKQNITPKRTKQKDPNGPKRPTNAYLIFCDLEKEKIRKELDSKTPGVTSDLSKALTEAWKSLDAEARKPYYSLYEEDKARYQRELEAYQKKQTEDSTPSNKKIKLSHESNGQELRME